MEWLLRRQDGVVTRQQALRYLSAKAVRYRVESGRWRRLHPGVFAIHSDPVTAAQRAWAAVLALGGDERPDGVCVAGLSALRGWGVAIEAPEIQVLVGAGRRVRAVAGVAPHRTATMPPTTGRPPTTLAPRSLVDAVQWARSDREAELLVATTFQRGLVTLADIERDIADRPNVRRRALLRRAAVDCSGGSHSTAELDLLTLCRRAKLPEPTRQVARRDRRGRLRFLDAAFEEYGVIVEVDGGHHLDMSKWRGDTVRANAWELDGYVVLRYPAFTIRVEPARVAAEIRQALRDRGWRR